MEYLKQEILKIESLYTDTSTNYSREWAFMKTRERVRGLIENATTTKELGQILLKLDKGFSTPFSLKYVNAEENDEKSK